jgi:hypothetical protein
MAEEKETTMLINTDFGAQDFRKEEYVAPELTTKYEENVAKNLYTFHTYWHWLMLITSVGVVVIQFGLMTLTSIFQNLKATFINPLIEKNGGGFNVTTEPVFFSADMALVSGVAVAGLAAYHAYVVFISKNYTLYHTAEYIRYEYEGWIHARKNPARWIAQGWVYAFIFIALGQIAFMQDMRFLISMGGIVFFSQIFIMVSSMFAVKESNRVMKQLFIIVNAYMMMALVIFPMLYAFVRVAWLPSTKLDSYPIAWTTALMFGVPSFILAQAINEIWAVARPTRIYWVHETVHLLAFDLMVLGVDLWFLFGSIGGDLPTRTYI